MGNRRDHRQGRARTKKLINGLQLHWLRPEDEERDCDFCRRYEHYSFRNADPAKRGRPIIELDRYVERGPRDEPKCELCGKSLAWTPENRALYRRWSFWRRGLDVGETDERTAWAFFALEEAARETQSALVTRDTNRAIVEALSG